MIKGRSVFFGGRGVFKKTSDKIMLADKIFLGLVVIMLLIPCAKFNLQDREIEENRMLKRWPEFSIASFSNGNNYFKSLEEWFNDRFHQRRRLIAYAYNLDAKINNEHVNDRALMGKENWIFTKERNSVGNFQNTTTLSTGEKDKIIKKLKIWQIWLKKQNIKFYLMVAPDKNQIYGEFYPDKIQKKGTENQIDLVVKCAKEANVPVIYPVSELLDQKNRGLLYYKNDTHWNSFGAYFGYKALMVLLQKDFPKIEILQEKQMVYNKQKFDNKDLERMLNLSIDEYNHINYPNISVAHPTAIKAKKNKMFPKATCLENAMKPYKLFVSGDSFTGSMLPFLGETFNTTTYTHTNHDIYNDQDLIMKIKPDIVVMEVIGKYVGDLLNDSPPLKEVQ